MMSELNKIIADTKWLDFQATIPSERLLQYVIMQLQAFQSAWHHIHNGFGGEETIFTFAEFHYPNDNDDRDGD